MATKPQYRFKVASENDVLAAFEAGKLAYSERNNASSLVAKYGAQANPHLSANVNLTTYPYRGRHQLRLGHAWLAGYILASALDENCAAPIDKRNREPNPNELWCLLW